MSDPAAIVVDQRRFFGSGRTRSVSFRIEKLKALKGEVSAREAVIAGALHEDLGKSPFEAYATEIGILLAEIGQASKCLPAWARRQRVKTPFFNFPSSGYIYREPYGVALIISPWNYPFQLAMAPLVGAIAAGNCVVVKPSEHSPHTSAVIADILGEVFEEEHVAVVQGGVETNRELLRERFDTIFFTGSVPVGRIVMEAASRHLTPVTLELGGKSPCIVDESAHLGRAARRIVWGKFLNAGQTCVAPDYLLVHRDVKEELCLGMVKYIRKHYGEDPAKSPDYPRIVNGQHFDRLSKFLEKGNIVAGGESDREALFISPTVIDGVTWDDPVMQEEIFGPILPVLEYDDIREVIEVVRSRPKPLALYIFSRDKAQQERVLTELSYGGGCVNDTIMHVSNPWLPFGGVGESGMGSYHGKRSFDTFSHQKSILKQPVIVDMPFRYPPYEGKLKFLRRLLK